MSDSNVIKAPFEVGATLTPEELANLLDLAAKAPVSVGVTLKLIAPVFQRASQLASLPKGTRIGALPVDPEPKPDPAAAAQLELPSPFAQTKRARARVVRVH
jgi:hypothetical protein